MMLVLKVMLVLNKLLSKKGLNMKISKLLLICLLGSMSVVFGSLDDEKQEYFMDEIDDSSGNVMPAEIQDMNVDEGYRSIDEDSWIAPSQDARMADEYASVEQDAEEQGADKSFDERLSGYDLDVSSDEPADPGVDQLKDYDSDDSDVINVDPGFAEEDDEQFAEN